MGTEVAFILADAYRKSLEEVTAVLKWYLIHAGNCGGAKEAIERAEKTLGKEIEAKPGWTL